MARVVCLLGLATACAAAAVPAYSYGASPASSWTLTFDDEFDGTRLNSSLWETRDNETHCEPCEPQLYVADAVALRGGSLILTTARADNILGPSGAHFNFTSGWIDSKRSFSQKFGLFETRVLLPPQQATGIWPAFWTLPSNTSQCWPMGGEIDVFEYTANPLINDVFGSYRWGTACGDDNQLLPGAGFPANGSSIDWNAAYHIIAVVWNDTALSFYVDGEVYETKSAAEVILPSSPQYMILNAAVAWYFMPGPDAAYPCETAFDYVRVYSA